MSAFLLLVGLTLFISGGAMYMAHAARHEPRWIVASMLLPVMVPLYYRRHWDELQIAGLLQSSGLVMALAGGLMLAFQAAPAGESGTSRDGTVFSSSKSQGYAGFVDSSRALRLLAKLGPGVAVAGRLNGSAFNPDRVELIDGVLRLSQGRGFIPDHEIAIILGDIELKDGRLKRVIGPYGGTVPEIQLLSRDAAGQSFTQVFRRGYRLDLELAPTVPGKLAGYMQLTLPDAQESFAGGDLEVLTSHLRYRNGEVDRTFDHADTVHFVAEDYLHSQYKEGAIADIAFSSTALDVLEGRADTQARVTLDDGRVGSHLIKLAKTEYGWSVLGKETAAATEAAGFKPVYNVLPPEGWRDARPVVSEKPARKAAAPKAAERDMAFADLSALTGQGAELRFADGRVVQGVLRGMSKDRLLVDAIKGGGTIQFRVAPGELLSLRMNSGDVIRLAGARAGTSSAAAAAASAPAATVSVGGTDVTRFINKSVKVVTADGKTTSGVFRGVQKDRLVIEVAVGGGKVDYTVPSAQLVSIDFAGR